ncbi:HAD-IA family hydrolase [Candidatus Microgenomates bacterium]|nr:HAD-IA family hydrolase [Candidatus Microgenomates bacterium]
MKKAVLFDLDGTLVDTAEFIYQAYEYALSFHKLEVVKREALAPLIGHGLEVIYQTIAPKGDHKSLVDTHISFQEERFHLIKSFPSIISVIRKLKNLGFKIGVVTSRMKNTSKTLKASGMNEDLFDVIVTGDQVSNPKPHPEGVIIALKKLNIKPDNALMVGDATADIEMGKNAGVKTVGVTYGFGGKNIAKSNPDFVIDDLEELLKVLKYS